MTTEQKETQEKTIQEVRRERKLSEKLSLIVKFTPSDTHENGTRSTRRMKVKRNPRIFKKSPRNK